MRSHQLHKDRGRRAAARERKVQDVSKLLGLAGVLLALAAVPAAASTSMIHLSGACWEEGGFPPSIFGEELTAVGIVTQIKRPLFWSPSRFSYTWHASGLMSLGESVYGDTHVVEYAGGTFRIHVDALPSNATYGTFPPNATSPGTFMDGQSTYLEGNFTSFFMTLNTTTGSGSVFGSLTFTGGNAYPQLESPDGWTVGAQITGSQPAGYDADWNGSLFVEGPLPVENASWGSIKTLYR
jgi:hypothetical protein